MHVPFFPQTIFESGPLGVTRRPSEIEQRDAALTERLRKIQAKLTSGDKRLRYLGERIEVAKVRAAL